MVKAPAANSFLAPRSANVKYALKRGRLVGAGMALALVQELEPLAGQVEISRDYLKVTLAPPGKYFKSMSYEIATRPDAATLREVISAAAAVARRLLAATRCYDAQTSAAADP